MELCKKYCIPDSQSKKIGQIWAKIINNIAESLSENPEASQMSPIHPDLSYVAKFSWKKHGCMFLDQFDMISIRHWFNY